ncbi:MAG: TIGR03619 family F420-dependent LLM class oxidoreductase [Roseiflexaceae bacterium]|nr:TIGR03619 family F420-dependent LLM class oxidoreductase [Roseiflexaceae bacterium]
MSTRENILHFAQEAEQAGYDSLWVFERLLYPLEPKQTYGGTSWPEAYQRVLDPLDTLAFVAAATDTIRLGTSVLDFLYTTPAQLAKRIGTLDVLSNGRALIGAGVGWSEDEFAASNVPFARRGPRMTEFIEALLALWGPDPVAFQGEFYQIPATLFQPKPLQQPRPLIVIGAYAPSSVARAIQLADGFNPVAAPEAAANQQLIGMLRKAWYDAGRTSAAPEMIVRVNHGYVAERPLAANRQFLTGSIDQVYADLQQLAAWGATEVFFDVSGHYAMLPDGYQQMLQQLAWLREIVAPVQQLKNA